MVNADFPQGTKKQRDNYGEFNNLTDELGLGLKINKIVLGNPIYTNTTYTHTS